MGLWVDIERGTCKLIVNAGRCPYLKIETYKKNTSLPQSGVIMKRMIIPLLLILVASAVQAFPVGIVVRFPDGSIETQCIHMKDDPSAEDALKASRWETDWQGSGSTAFLTELESISNDNLDAWSFWVETDDIFESSMVGFGQYTMSEEEVFGVSYATFTPPDYLPEPVPPFYDYDQVCGLEIRNLKAYVDGDRRDDVDETGEDIDRVRPLSEVKIIFDLKNIFSDDIDDIKVTGTILDLDGDIEHELEEFDLNDGEREQVTLLFDIPADAKEETYPLHIDIYGDDGVFEFFSYLDLGVDLDKNQYDMVIDSVIVGDKARCGSTLPVTINLINPGNKDQDVKVLITNDELGISESFSITVESEEDSNEIEQTMDVDIPFLAADGDYDLRITIDHQLGSMDFVEEFKLEGCVGGGQDSTSDGSSDETGSSEGSSDQGSGSDMDVGSSSVPQTALPPTTIPREGDSGMPLMILIAVIVVVLVLILMLMLRR